MKKKIILLLCLTTLIFWSCGMSNDDVARETKDLMMQEAKKDRVDLKFKDFNVVHESGNKYTGMAECTVDGESIKYSIDIVCDGENIQAQWTPVE